MQDVFIYDLSCLIFQQVSLTPSGTVRVDLRYATYFLNEKRDATIFVRQFNNQLVTVDTGDAQALIEHLLFNWHTDDGRDQEGNFKARNLEFRMCYHDLWDPDFETFFSMPYADRFNYLANQELTEILGSEFAWVKRLPYFVKIAYSAIAGLSRYLALFLIRSGQFIGVYLHSRSFRQAFRFVFKKRRKMRALDDIIARGEESNRESRYYYIYTAYNRGFPFKSLKQLGEHVALEYVVYIHDLILINYPEYFLPVDHKAQSAWLIHLLKRKPLLITNSDTTKSHILAFAQTHDLELRPVVTSFIGVEPGFAAVKTAAAGVEARSYFVFISTIEPRKNHLLLLNIWREMALEAEGTVPELYLVGKRGWENENVIDMVERCPSIKGLVHEVSDMKDPELVTLLRGARALLYPSFCEGWGMPIVEALSLGVPVICSDIPELRESGQNIPDYISPIDGKKWKEVILDYSAAGSQLRRRQMTRIGDYRPPTWEAHFDTTMDAILGRRGTG